MNHRVLLVLGLLLCSAQASDAGWGAGGCAVAQTAPFSGWEASANEPHIFGWFQNGVQTAYYNSRTHVYRTYDAARDVWGPPQRAPWLAQCKSNCQCEQCEDGCDCRKGEACGDARCACLLSKKVSACACNCGCGGDCACAEVGPCEEGCSCQPGRRNVGAAKNPGRKRDCQWAEADGTMNYGLDRSKIAAREKFSINGVEVDKHKAFEAIGADIPNDGGLLRMTVIGSEGDRKRVLDDLAKMPERDKLVVQDYPPDHWAVKGAGFVTSGKPTIYLQAPSGKVLHRQDEYAGPAPLVEAIRKADPNYDPKKDKDLNAAPLVGEVPVEAMAGIGLSGLALAAAFLFGRKP